MNEPRKELVDGVVVVLGVGKMYYGDIFLKLRTKLSQADWDEVAGCLSYLVTNGWMEAKGDGFGVQYSFTQKGIERYRPLNRI